MVSVPQGVRTYNRMGAPSFCASQRLKGPHQCSPQVMVGRRGLTLRFEFNGYLEGLVGVLAEFDHLL